MATQGQVGGSGGLVGISQRKVSEEPCSPPQLILELAGSGMLGCSPERHCHPHRQWGHPGDMADGTHETNLGVHAWNAASIYALTSRHRSWEADKRKGILHGTPWFPADSS